MIGFAAALLWPVCAQHGAGPERLQPPSLLTNNIVPNQASSFLPRVRHHAKGTTT